MDRGPRLVCAVAEIVTRDGAFDDLWLACVDPLLALARAAKACIVTLDSAGRSVVHAPSACDDGIAPAREAMRIGVPIARDRAFALPLRYAGKTVGALVLFDCGLAGNDALLALVETAAYAIAARINHETTQRAADRFAHLAFVDALTGIANRRRFDETLRTEWSRAARERTWLAMLVADIDFFKVYNDGYGHQAGDVCLHEVANILNGCVQRPGDLIARYGGEEFVALLPGTDLRGGIALGERFRAALAERSFAHGGSSLGRLSLSVGVAAVVPSPEASPDALIRAADAALYEAKLNGRDRVWAPHYVVEREALYQRRPTAPNNVVLPATRLIGRVAEVAETLALLHDRRLVTIVGAAGAGKTRVALQVAVEAMARHGDGVWFVNLATIADGALTAPAIGAAMGITAAENDLDAVIRAIGVKSVLLILDNCEHVVGSVAVAARGILAACPQANILATSRELLELPDEATYRLLAFRLPDPRAAVSAVEAAGFDAVQLFAERARAVDPLFTLSDANAADVTAICRRADGNALGIELAAARAADPGITALVRLLGDRQAARGFRLPDARNAVRTFIAWSYRLLAPRERALLRRLAIFAESWSTDDAAAVAADLGTPEEIAQAHAGLRRAGLVMERRGDATRHRFLTPIRDFAREMLVEKQEDGAAAAAHARRLGELADTVDGGPLRMAPTAGLPWAIDDVRAALGWCFGAGGDPVCGARIVAGFAAPLFALRQSEALRWTRRAAFALPDDAPRQLRARILMHLAHAAGALAHEALDAATQARTLFEEIDDPVGTIEATLLQARVIGQYFTESRARAVAVAGDALAQARGLGDPVVLLQSLATFGGMLEMERQGEKRAAFEEALRIAHEQRNDLLLCEVSIWSSENAFAANELMDAIAYGMQALHFAESAESADLTIACATNLAFYACAAGDLELAGRVGRRALALARDADAASRVTFAVQALAAVSAQQRDDERAARLLGFTDARAGVLHASRQTESAEERMFAWALETLRGRMGDEEFARAFEAGATLDLERAEREAMR